MVRRAGCFTVSVSGVLWLASSHVLLNAGGIAYRQPNADGHHGELTPRATRTWQGVDRLGIFNAFSIEWQTAASHSACWATTFRVYSSPNAKVVFEQEFHASVAPGMTNVSTAERNPTSWANPSSVFPSFSASAAKAPELGAISFHNQGDPQTAIGLGNLNPELMGFVGGVPVVLTDQSSGKTLVLSPLSAFLSTTFTVSSSRDALSAGVQGAASTIPKGHKVEVLLQLGNGISQTVLDWGGTLLKFWNKPPTALDANAHVSRLGYSGVGHYFCALCLPTLGRLLLVSAHLTTAGHRRPDPREKC